MASLEVWSFDLASNEWIWALTLFFKEKISAFESWNDKEKF